MTTTDEVVSRLRALGACQGACDRVAVAVSVKAAWRTAPVEDLWWLLGRIHHPGVGALLDRCVARADASAARARGTAGEEAAAAAAEEVAWASSRAKTWTVAEAGSGEAAEVAEATEWAAEAGEAAARVAERAMQRADIDELAPLASVLARIAEVCP